MTAPKQPDGGWDPSAGGDSAGTTGSARTTLWDLNGLNEKVPIIVDYGSSMTAASRSRLDPYDRDLAERSATPAVPGLPADLVKRPIQLYATDPKAYLDFQRALFAGGFYGSSSPTSIPWGSDPTGATYDAWKRVLTAAQQAQASGLNVTPEQVLAQGVAQHKAATAAGPKNPLVIQQTDPAVLRGLVQRAAQSSLHRNLSDAEVASFVRAFHEEEAAYSKRRFAAQEDQTGGTHTLVAPDASAQAEEFVQGGHSAEASNEREADLIGVLQQMLGG